MSGATPHPTLVDQMGAIADGWFQLFWRLVCPFVAPVYGALLCNWIRRKQRGFATLVARIRTGKLPARRVRAPRERAERARAEFRLPSTRGWLLKMLAAQGGSAGHWQMQLHHLLHFDPEMKDLIAAAPEQMGRLMRPLCKAASIDLPDALKLKRKPAKTFLRRSRKRSGEAQAGHDPSPGRTLQEQPPPVAHPAVEYGGRGHFRSPFEPPAPLDPNPVGLGFLRR